MNLFKTLIISLLVTNTILNATKIEVNKEEKTFNLLDPKKIMEKIF